MYKSIDDMFDAREMEASKELRRIQLLRKYYAEMQESGCDRAGKNLHILKDRVIEEAMEQRMKEDRE